MITMKDPALTVYPNRQQMLALIRARTLAGVTETRCSAESDTGFQTCVFVLAD